MTDQMKNIIEPERIKYLNNLSPKKGKYVLYWMQSAQRSEFNHALEYAIQQANITKKPLVVLFCIEPDFPEANARHYYFMLEGIKETQKALKGKRIQMVVKVGKFVNIVPKLAKNATEVITDSGYLRFQIESRRKVAEKLDCKLTQIETNLIVPPQIVSTKEEYSARTFRQKIAQHLNKFIKKIPNLKCARSSFVLHFSTVDVGDPKKVMKKFRIDNSVGRTEFFKGGTSEAKKLLKIFIKEKLADYHKYSRDPSKNYLSNMSPYLHFGQISPVYIALQVLKNPSPGAKAYLEELIVRRELAHNFVLYNPNYDRLKSTANWAIRTLNVHKRDRRKYIYSLQQLENAQTHDRYWNAAQVEMVVTGKMHSYMRMYWGKKILEWTKTPQQAFKTALYLNNKYELDGRDPNSYAGICWCFGKHDTAWKQRQIFGKVRYMSFEGLRRKFDMEKYVRTVIEKSTRAKSQRHF